MTTQSIIATLETLRSTIADENLEQASEQFAILQGEYQEATGQEAIRQNRFIAAHNLAALTNEERMILSEYAAKASSIQAQRARLTVQAGQYLSDPDFDMASLLDTLEATVAAEQELLARRGDAGNVEVDRELPARISLVSVETGAEVVPKGSSSTLSVSVTNAGDKPSDSVTLEISTDEGVSLETSTTALGSIATSKTTEVLLTATSAGESSIDVTCFEDGETVDIESTTLTVWNKASFIDAARQRIDDAMAHLDGGGLDHALMTKLENADKKLAQASKWLDNTNGKRTQNAIDAGKNILEGLKNQLNSEAVTVNEQAEKNKKNGNGNRNGTGTADTLSNEILFYFTEDVESAIKLIDLAKTAEV